MKEAPKKFKEGPFKYHEEVELKIENLTNLGLGVGRVDGWVVMVPFVIPGERVRARIFRNYANYSNADLVEVLEAAPSRVDAKCSLFGNCGGCQYQHMTYDEQLKWKRQHILETMERIGGLEVEVCETIGSPEAFGYRSKLTPHFPKVRDEGVPIGFHRVGSRSVLVDVPQCPIAMDGINAALPEERRKILTRERKFKKGGTLFIRETPECVTTDNKAIVTEKVGDFVFQFKAGDFFQNNPYILPLLVDHALGEAKGEGVRYLIDAYCGVGLFALCGSKVFERVAGVEVNASAIDWAKVNAEINKVKNCDFIVGEAENIFENVAFGSDETAIIIDPPRKGCTPEFIEQLIEYGPKRVVYVSCEPSTQARDLSLLKKAYQVSKVQPFDLFPQTRHVENVVTLIRG